MSSCFGQYKASIPCRLCNVGGLCRNFTKGKLDETSFKYNVVKIEEGFMKSTPQILPTPRQMLQGKRVLDLE